MVFYLLEIVIVRINKKERIYGHTIIFAYECSLLISQGENYSEIVL